jgi:hypothetical protein
MPKLTEDKRQIKLGRALFAATGLRRLLVPGGLKVTRADLSKAGKLEEEIYDVIGRFMAGEEEEVLLPPYDHADVSDLLLRAMDDEQLTEKLARFRNDPAQDDYFQVADRAYAFLRGKVPRRFRVTFLGRVPLEPSRSELMNWRWFLETATNPLWAVKQLLAGTLLQQHVECLAVVWPDVLQAARFAVNASIAEMLEKDPEANLTRRQIRQLYTLTGNDPTTPPALLQALQAAFAGTQPGEQSSPQKTEALEELKTSNQRIAER